MHYGDAPYHRALLGERSGRCDSDGHGARSSACCPGTRSALQCSVPAPVTPSHNQHWQSLSVRRMLVCAACALPVGQVLYEERAAPA